MLLQSDLDLTNYILDHCDEENCFNGRTTCIFPLSVWLALSMAKTLPFITQTRHWKYATQRLFRCQKENIKADKTWNKITFPLTTNPCACLRIWKYFTSKTTPNLAVAQNQNNRLPYAINQIDILPKNRDVSVAKNYPAICFIWLLVECRKLRNGPRSTPNIKSTGTFFSLCYIKYPQFLPSLSCARTHTHPHTHTTAGFIFWQLFVKAEERATWPGEKNVSFFASFTPFNNRHLGLSGLNSNSYRSTPASPPPPPPPPPRPPPPPPPPPGSWQENMYRCIV